MLALHRDALQDKLDLDNYLQFCYHVRSSFDSAVLPQPHKGPRPSIPQRTGSLGYVIFA